MKEIVSTTRDSNPMRDITVGVVGGGPAGAFVAYLLAQQGTRVDIYESRQSRQPDTAHGEKRLSCTGCAGLVQPNAIALLERHGITIPPSVIETTLEGATVHFPGDESLRVSSYKGAVTVYRGFGPLRPEGRPVDSFDASLLLRAVEAGAHHYPVKIEGIDLRDKKGKVHVLDSGGIQHEADMVIGAFGHNPSLMAAIIYPRPGMPPLEQPTTQRASVREYFFGEDKVKELLGAKLHVLGNPSESIWFSALIPKRDYITVVLMGRQSDIKAGDYADFLSNPQVRRLLREDLNERRPNCGCLCTITLTSPERFVVEGDEDKVIMVNIGDAGPTRPRKNGIFAAFDNAEHLASALIQYGNRASGLREYEKYMRQKYVWDNQWAETALSVSDFILNHSVPRRTICYVARNRIPLLTPMVRSAIDHVLTGRDSYWRIPMNVLRESLVMPFAPQ